MNEEIIAMCGAPKVGKDALLWQVSLTPGFSKRKVALVQQTTRVLSLRLPLQNRDVSLIAASGAILDKELSVRWILNKASAIIYVVAPASSSVLDQDEWFGLHLAVARSIGKTWDDVPWQFVLNKADQGDDHPILTTVPQRFRECLLRTQAKDGDGIDLFLKRIEELCSMI